MEMSAVVLSPIPKGPGIALSTPLQPPSQPLEDDEEEEKDDNDDDSDENEFTLSDDESNNHEIQNGENSLGEKKARVSSSRYVVCCREYCFLSVFPCLHTLGTLHCCESLFPMKLNVSLTNLLYFGGTNRMSYACSFARTTTLPFFPMKPSPKKFVFPCCSFPYVSNMTVIVVLIRLCKHFVNFSLLLKNHFECLFVTSVCSSFNNLFKIVN